MDPPTPQNDAPTPSTPSPSKKRKNQTELDDIPKRLVLERDARDLAAHLHTEGYEILKNMRMNCEYGPALPARVLPHHTEVYTFNLIVTYSVWDILVTAANRHFAQCRSTAISRKKSIYRDTGRNEVIRFYAYVLVMETTASNNRKTI